MNRRSLECPICLLPYENNGNYPVALLCGHSFCSSCSKTYPNNAGNCPICRKEFQFPEGFTKHVTLLECINRLNEGDNLDLTDNRKAMEHMQRSATSYIASQMHLIKDLADRLTAVENENEITKNTLRKVENENESLKRTISNLENGGEIRNKLERMSEEMNRYADSIEELQLFVANVNDGSKNYAKQEDINRLQDSIGILTKKQDMLREVLDLQQQNADRSRQILQEFKGQNSQTNSVSNEKPANLEMLHQNSGRTFRPPEARFETPESRKFEKFIGRWKMVKRERDGFEQDISNLDIQSHSFEPVPEGVMWKEYKKDGSEWFSSILTTDKEIKNKLEEELKDCVLVEFQTDGSFEWGWIFTYNVEGNHLIERFPGLVLTLEKC